MGGMMDHIGLHTLDTEAYEAAFRAAVESLQRSDQMTAERLRTLAEEDGVVAEAAALVAAGESRERLQALTDRDGFLGEAATEALDSLAVSTAGALPAHPEQRIARLRFLMDERKTWPESHYGDYDYAHLTAIVGDREPDGEPNTGGDPCPRYAAISYDETYSFIYLFDTQEEAAEHLAGTLGEETGGSIDGVVDLDTGVYYRATANVQVELTHPQDRYVEVGEEPT